MNLIFKNRKIVGIQAVVPANERLFVDDMANFNFPINRSMKLKDVMGYDRHRLVDGPVCASDLACHGLENLFESGRLARDGFDALVVVTQSPDYLMPATSSVIHGKLGLKRDMLCLDLNQGCAGFLVGLVQGFQLLDQPAISRVVLVNVDVLSRKVSPRDRNSYPLIGDAASIAILERCDDDTTIFGNIYTDGSRREALMIPAGGFRAPSSPESAVMVEDSEGNWRAPDHLRMDGSAVFNFVQVEVPPMIESLLAQAGVSSNDVDGFVFHQPNRFMLQKLADRLGVPHDKVPMNVVEHYGNSSGVTIPVAIAHNLHEKLLKESMLACMAGFGVGLTWCSMLMRLGPLAFCELIQYP